MEQGEIMNELKKLKEYIITSSLCETYASINGKMVLLPQSYFTGEVDLVKELMFDCEINKSIIEGKLKSNKEKLKNEEFTYKSNYFYILGKIDTLEKVMSICR